MYKYPTEEQIEEATKLITLDHLANIERGQRVKVGSVDRRDYFLYSDTRDNLWEDDEEEMEEDFDIFTLEDSEETLASVMYEDEERNSIIFDILI